MRLLWSWRRKRWMEAGRIASEARRMAACRIVEGARYADVANYTEKLIRELGAVPAFPTNLAVNHVAAHDTPTYRDERRFRPGDVVKLDLGVSVHGFLADTAATVLVPPVSRPIRSAAAAVKRALEAGIGHVRRGMLASEVGRILEECMWKGGVLPVEQLFGHQLRRYILHSGLMIPCTSTGPDTPLPNGVYALEPFGALQESGAAVTGRRASVKEAGTGEIYVLTGRSAPADRECQIVVKELKRTYGKLPFAVRWLMSGQAEWDLRTLRQILARLTRARAVKPYPVFVGKKGMPIFQFEHTLLIEGRRVTVTTL